jgi:hypothetical protein
MKPRPAAWLIIVAIAFAIPMGAGTLNAENPAGDAAAAMRARYDAMRDRLGDNPFEQPIHVSSDSNDERVRGELAGVIEHPFENVIAAFKSAGNWCDIMMLHLNVKYCRASAVGPDQILTVFVGRKHHQPLESAYPGEYAYRVLEERPDYFKVALTAASGPFRTRNYRILLEAVPADHGHTFVHFDYSYDFGALARAAKSLYFHTAGREKVGFTVVDNMPDGQPVHIGGVRGALERNIMRYYLAMKAYMGALSVPGPEQLEKRLNDWFALTERYPRQLHELDKNEYLRMKRQEHERQQTRFDAFSPAGPSW